MGDEPTRWPRFSLSGPFTWPLEELTMLFAEESMVKKTATVRRYDGETWQDIRELAIELFRLPPELIGEPNSNRRF